MSALAIVCPAWCEVEHDALEPAGAMHQRVLGTVVLSRDVARVVLSNWTANDGGEVEPPELCLFPAEALEGITPAEARQLAAALLDAADKADAIGATR